ncbi:MAG: Sir2 family NAD-dependent protein deacetylase [Hydrogenophaga sp.]|uniref:SIR2 family NAD-dependent protein deacylase n=1 Tax=Hydrogenophaga sp. TaxID=1904254 RepID=UPI0026357AA0|nr:Sir2 family NAD-dependent protein deacetylase [Hydrogenophaga sp.]MDM7943518.1 Sir2 family NAD-dependent protein deacetylase [Hydrogenophaga sp.]
MNEPCSEPIDMSPVERAACLIQQADALIVAAGAGMGVDSGLPDFRGKDGFWRAYPALREAQIDFENIASPAAFHASPERAWGFYGHRLALYRETVPHRGFDLLRQWGDRMLHGLSVFTSNVDGQFQKPGFDQAHIHECHGSIHHLQCLEPCSQEVWLADSFQPDVDEQSCQLRNPPPACPACGGLARPNVLMFADWGWTDQRTEAQAKRQQAWLCAVTQPVVIELGAGTAMPTVRHFSRRVIHQHGGRLIRINPNDCTVPTRLDAGLPMGAADGLAAIAKVLGAEWSSAAPEGGDGGH